MFLKGMKFGFCPGTEVIFGIVNMAVPAGTRAT